MKKIFITAALIVTSILSSTVSAQFGDFLKDLDITDPNSGISNTFDNLNDRFGVSDAAEDYAEGVGEDIVTDLFGNTGVGPIPDGEFVLPCPEEFGAVGQNTSARSFILRVVDFSLTFLGLIAVVMIIYAGYLYVVDAGEGGNQEKAKKIIMYAIIGIVLILGSYAIINTVITGIATDPDNTDSNISGSIDPFDGSDLSRCARNQSELLKWAGFGGSGFVNDFGYGILVRRDQEVTFSAEIPDEMEIVSESMAWNIGNGWVQTGSDDYAHTFYTDGWTGIRFAVEDANGRTHNLYKRVLVGDGATARFFASNEYPQAGDEIILDASQSTAEYGSIDEYDWYCSDPSGSSCSISFEDNVSTVAQIFRGLFANSFAPFSNIESKKLLVRFKRPGIHTIRLRVRTNIEGEAEIEKPIIVLESDGLTPPEYKSLTAEEFHGVGSNDGIIKLTAEVTDAEDGDPNDDNKVKAGNFRFEVLNDIEEIIASQTSSLNQEIFDLSGFPGQPTPLKFRGFFTDSDGLKATKIIDTNFNISGAGRNQPIDFNVPLQAVEGDVYQTAVYPQDYVGNGDYEFWWTSTALIDPIPGSEKEPAFIFMNTGEKEITLEIKERSTGKIRGKKTKKLTVFPNPDPNAQKIFLGVAANHNVQTRKDLNVQPWSNELACVDESDYDIEWSTDGISFFPGDTVRFDPIEKIDELGNPYTVDQVGKLKFYLKVRTKSGGKALCDFANPNRILDTEFGQQFTVVSREVHVYAEDPDYYRDPVGPRNPDVFLGIESLPAVEVNASFEPKEWSNSDACIDKNRYDILWSTDGVEFSAENFFNFPNVGREKIYLRVQQKLIETTLCEFKNPNKVLGSEGDLKHVTISKYISVYGLNSDGTAPPFLGIDALVAAAVETDVAVDEWSNVAACIDTNNYNLTWSTDGETFSAENFLRYDSIGAKRVYLRLSGISAENIICDFKNPEKILGDNEITIWKDISIYGAQSRDGNTPPEITDMTVRELHPGEDDGKIAFQIEAEDAEDEELTNYRFEVQQYGRTLAVQQSSADEVYFDLAPYPGDPADFRFVGRVVDSGGLWDEEELDKAFVIDENAAENRPPTVVIIPTPSNVGTPDTNFQFLAQARDLDGDYLTYSWKMPDDGVYNTRFTPYQFSEIGEYTIQVTVSDGFVSVTDDQIIQIVDPNSQDGSGGTNRPPEVSLTKISPCDVGHTRTIFSMYPDVFDPDGDALAYTWEFGDGTRLYSRNVAHRFRLPGTYVVKLTVSDGIDETIRIIEFTVVEFGDFVPECSINVYVRDGESDLNADQIGIKNKDLIKEQIDNLYGRQSEVQAEIETLNAEKEAIEIAIVNKKKECADLSDEAAMVAWKEARATQISAENPELGAEAIQTQINGELENRKQNCQADLQQLERELFEKEAVIAEKELELQKISAEISNLERLLYDDFLIEGTPDTKFFLYGSLPLESARALFLEWDTGDERTFLGQNIVIKYNEPGLYRVEMKVTDGLVTVSDVIKIKIHAKGFKKSAPKISAATVQSSEKAETTESKTENSGEISDEAVNSDSQTAVSETDSVESGVPPEENSAENLETQVADPIKN